MLSRSCLKDLQALTFRHTKMRHVGVEPTLQEPESCVRSITLAAQYYIILVEVG